MKLAAIAMIVAALAAGMAWVVARDSPPESVSSEDAAPGSVDDEAGVSPEPSQSSAEQVVAEPSVVAVQGGGAILNPEVFADTADSPSALEAFPPDTSREAKAPIDPASVRMEGSAQLVEDDMTPVDIGRVRPEGTERFVAAVSWGDRVLATVETCARHDARSSCVEEARSALAVLLDRESGRVVDQQPIPPEAVYGELVAGADSTSFLLSAGTAGGYYTVGPIRAFSLQTDSDSLAVEPIPSPGQTSSGFPGSFACSDIDGNLYSLDVETTAQPGQQASNSADKIVNAVVRHFDPGRGDWVDVPGMESGPAYWGASIGCSEEGGVLLSGGPNPVGDDPAATRFLLTAASDPAGRDLRQVELPGEMSTPLGQAAPFLKQDGELLLLPSGFTNSGGSVLSVSTAPGDMRPAETEDPLPSIPANLADSLAFDGTSIYWLASDGGKLSLRSERLT